MLKKVINYEDFDGNKRTEEHYFHLNKIELTEMAIALPDDVTSAIGDDPENIDEEKAAARILATLGSKGVLDFVKDLVKKSYGIKSSDGKKFSKKPEHFEEFSETLAYESLMEELMFDQVKAAEFVNAVISSSAKKVTQFPAKQ